MIFLVLDSYGSTLETVSGVFILTSILSVIPSSALSAGTKLLFLVLRYDVLT